ncbi:hypothetical protein AMAG_07924 [Allomyces macrogynus ATCC 38327]|uniref:Chaperone DnaJ n=1 Tax=Allomyces macrogynus (strain ATCC 38327) TaxID=578462 RepID=A0A0L0SJS7_ALLM3|nr:hypothetical protein AMAG_07924 [Allomyces macrogynus ATCC 38327]|eukprot:KNE62738.1 hypothetical protein AMAG_07924 [Allomyces macrogynus ATCC 38327]
MVRDTKLYDILGASPEATDSQLKKCYHKLALSLHPDKNPSPEAAEKFKEVTRAYEILSDSQKRQIYDQYGEQGLEGGMGGMGGMGGSPADLFEQIFGFGGGGARQRHDHGPKKGKDMAHVLKVSLEDLYNGKTTKLALNKQVLCAPCNGKGTTKEGAEIVCATCRGQGVRVQIRQIGPMIQQFQSACSDCDGKGKSIAPKDRCKNCNGKKVTNERKVLEVHIEKGMRDGTKITFRGESDQFPGMLPGDVVIILEEKPHDKFKRDGTQLYIEQTVDLLTALAGGQFAIKHLDGRHLLVQVIQGEILTPGIVKIVPGEGFPTQRHHEFGDLHIKFNIDFPTAADLDPSKLALLEQALPARPTLPALKGDVEEVVLATPDPNARGGSGSRAHMDAMDEDDDEGGHGGPGVQCATQ